jgi:hypothetical protein
MKENSEARRALEAVLRKVTKAVQRPEKFADSAVYAEQPTACPKMRVSIIQTKNRGIVSLPGRERLWNQT